MSHRAGTHSRFGPTRLRLPHPRLAALPLAAVVTGLVLAMATEPVRTAIVRSVELEPGAAGERLGALAALVVAVGSLLASVRLWRSHRQAAHPGTIEIVPPVEVPDQLRPEEITAALRGELTSMNLTSPSTVPGEAAPQDFITDVRTAAASPSRGWRLALAAVLWLRPPLPYQVALVIRVDQRRVGLTVEVRSRVGRGLYVTTVWDDSWEQVISRAACHIAAQVLPRTSLSRLPPWTPWRGVRIDPEVFCHFHDARRYAASGRFEEAIAEFNRATALDPRNPYIRFEKATVLEQLGLYIDALAIYVDVTVMESWYDRRVWRRYRQRFGDRRHQHRRPWFLRRSPNGAAALQLARYRMVTALATSNRLTAQWEKHRRPMAEPTGVATPGPWPGRDPQGRRQEDAERVIHRLRHHLGAYGTLMLRWTDPKSAAVSSADIEGDRGAMRRVLQFAAMVEAQEIADDYRWTTLRRWRRGLPVSQSAIRILPPWSALQYRYVEIVQASQATADESSDPPAQWWRLPLISDKQARLPVAGVEWQPPNETARLPWPPPPELVSRLVSKALRQQRRWLPYWLPAHRGWLEHYNAACLYAVGMLTNELVTTETLTETAAAHHQQLVKLAIDQLRLAVMGADSQFAAGRADWLRWGDQDLDDLRVTRDFDTFVDRYLPGVSPLIRLPPNAALLAITRHLARLVEQYARTRRRAWERAADSGEPVDMRDEPAWWKLLRAFCRDYRDWATRLSLIAMLTRASPDFDPAMPGIGQDKEWATVAWRPMHQGGQVPRSSVDRVREWLETEVTLHRSAEALIRRRNQALDDLHQVLVEALIDEALHELWFAAADSRTIADAHVTAWWRVERYMRSLRHGRLADPDMAQVRAGLEAIRDQAGAALGGSRRRRLRGSGKLRSRPDQPMGQP
ncbi:tetratricopeptide repeat protein [Natronosporangium hydrolyticum]|uniref:Tetratricopeptide repeat protein n=1 Tax=Natronosporangium hydrolyticum TaxID=2811111 RepID=A0A895YQ28_9ACTN|nr:tetratricopeptide repeat protein [Natronosporangium hydrolyticum]QSB16846.1 tetratricopeptide repeat protein [Natronosporangium hydrolyticum]